MSAIFMDIQPVILWTDGLIFALLAGVLALAWGISRQEHLRAPWAAVGRVGRRCLWRRTDYRIAVTCMDDSSSQERTRFP